MGHTPFLVKGIGTACVPQKAGRYLSGFQDFRCTRSEPEREIPWEPTALSWQ